MKAIVGIELRLILVAVFLLISAVAEKRKRQIFREQVLPALGGKIPEEAFRMDRLALNRLNKDGITVPDGMTYHARNVHRHNQRVQTAPEILKVSVAPDGRYFTPENKFNHHYNRANTIDTTYVIRAPYSRFGNHKHRADSNYFGKENRDSSNKQIFQVTNKYTNFRQLVPIIPPSKPGVYNSIVAPILPVLPVNTEFLGVSPSWDYEWNPVYQPFNDYIVDDIAFFNAHQIITDYQGFLNKFHQRTPRHAQLRTRIEFERTTRGEGLIDHYLNERNK